MHKIVRVIFLFFTSSFALACNPNEKSKENFNFLDKKEFKIKGLENQLSSILINYIEKEPVDLELSSNGYSSESYNLSFLPRKEDTLLIIFKQPFLINETFINRVYSNFTDTQLPKEILVKVNLTGIVRYNKTIVTIFDVDKSCNHLYDASKFEKELPKEILYKTPSKGEIWHPKKYPIHKYKVMGKQLIYLKE